MQCDHAPASDTRLAQTIKNRCGKFKKRHYTLRNTTRLCCKTCCFDHTRIPDGLTMKTNTDTYYMDALIKLLPPVATVQVSVGSRYNNTSVPEHKPMQLIPCNKGRPHVMRKGNENRKGETFQGPAPDRSANTHTWHARHLGDAPYGLIRELFLFLDTGCCLTIISLWNIFQAQQYSILLLRTVGFKVFLKHRKR